MRSLTPAMMLLLLAGAEASQAVTVVPLEFKQDLTRYNFQCRRGVPISSIVDTNIGSDGRMPTVNESWNSSNLPTSNQFAGFISYGATSGLLSNDWRSVSNVVQLRYGTNAFNGSLASQMKLPVGTVSNGVVVVVLRRAQVGAPYFIPSSTLSFGSLVSVPNTDERDILLTNVVPEQYWLPQPYATSNQLSAGYYWSPNASAVFAVQAGPVAITWRKAGAYSATTVPAYTNLNGTRNFETNGGSIYLLYTVRYIVSGNPVKPPRMIYWTEGEYQALGKPVTVPAGRVGNLVVVYNNNFPEFVSSNEVVLPPNQPFMPGTSDRTLWYDTQTQTRQIRAFNREGRVFLELLGDMHADNQTREHLGFEIVDVSRQPTPRDVAIELGEQLRPPSPGSLAELSPDPLTQLGGTEFAYRHNVVGSDTFELFAAAETHNLNDYLVHWMEEGLEGIKWPRYFVRYQLVWPADVARYSHYVRPLAATEAEAKATAIALSAEDVPAIQYQDPLDHLRANLTADYKFYTWLDNNYPAHRALLRFISGPNVAFERVFSWLDVNLKTTNFAGSVVEQLDAWNPTNQTVTWPDELTAPRLERQTVNVGDRLVAPDGEPGAMGDYLAGHINLSAGTLFDPQAYIDPLTSGFEAANRSAIIPVNAVPGANLLEVWWFRIHGPNAGPNAGDGTKGFHTVYWPSVIGRYTLQWPASPPEIVLASKLGSGTLDTFQAQGVIYTQNDPSLTGYNPNEEHALMSAGVAYATRDDLNVTNVSGYSSHPFVLLEYQAADGRPAITPFKVLREKPAAGYVFDYIVPAGQMLQAPMPLPLLGKPVDGSGDSAVNYNQEPSRQGGDLPVGWVETRDANGPFGYYKQFTYRDRHQDFWVYRGLHAGLPPLQAGTYNTNTKAFTPLTSATAIVGQPFSLYLHVSRQDDNLELTSPNKDQLTNGLGIVGLSLQGTPLAVATNTLALIVSNRCDQTTVTNTVTLRVLASGSVIGQEPLVISCTNSYTGTIVAYSNRPPFLAVSPTPSNSFTMRYYYKTQPGFAWPGLDNPPPAGSIVPYLRRYDPTNGVFIGDGASSGAEALDIAYRPVWPETEADGQALPTLPYGASLTLPNRGLPGVRDMKTARVLYQQSIATANITNARPSVVLHDPTREKYSDLAAQGLTALPSSVQVDYYQGKYYFPTLAPHLATRLFFDQNRGSKGSLVLKGEFKNETVGESYLLLNVLRGSDLAAAIALCSTNDTTGSQKWTALVNALAAQVDTFVENASVPGTYVTGSSNVVGVGDLAEVGDDNTAVDSYALSATGPGSGYVMLLEAGGTAFTRPGDPVAMHLFKVGGGIYTGELKVIPAANPLSEQVTFQHTLDLGGRFDEYEYEWRVAAPVDGAPPTGNPTNSYLLLTAVQTDLPRFTLGGAGVQALGDNYVIMRYRAKNPAHPLYNQWFTNWTEPKLAEGWIKRVLAGINPFNQRVTDLFNNPVNTDVSILTQAGHRWEGDVALNMDTINDYGLIEIYETVLRRGRSLTIESGYNYGPANDALLLAAGYLNDLYMMEGNEAWADAANPTIGIGTADRTYGDIATALFAFKGQMPSLLEEELALDRGRDDFMEPGVEVRPAYNRLYWNYTRGIDAGQVIYALNYDMLDQNGDGVVDAADAAVLYPQGHGDAYGHYLTALKGYYSLLLNSYFDWVPRTEAVNLLGQAVQVDYQDERKFAAAAAAVARVGRQVFDLTWRKDYQPVSAVGWSHFGATRSNTRRQVATTRYWGMDHWACRTSQGAYLNWVVGNALLPDVDPNPAHEGIQKIDRTTVPELQELTTLAQDLQSDLDNAEGGLSPLGLPQDALAFDLNPSVVVGTDNGTHFEQVYQRTKVALNNAVAAFDDAKDVTRLMRSEQDSLADFQAGVNKQEQAYNNSLIELYGTPYPDDMGPAKTYSQDYAGPDLIHYSYADLPETFNGLLTPTVPQTYQVDLQQFPEDWSTRFYTNMDFVVNNSSPDYINGNQYLEFTLGPHGFFDKPAAWTSRRRSPGRIQQAISDVIKAHDRLAQTLSFAVWDKSVLDQSIAAFNARKAVMATVNQLSNTNLDLAQEINKIQAAYAISSKWLQMSIAQSDAVKDLITGAVPGFLIAGTSVGGDMGTALKSPLYVANFIAKLILLTGDTIGFTVSQEQVKQRQEEILKWSKTIAALQSDQDTKDAVQELSAQLAALQVYPLQINAQLRELDDAAKAYAAAVAGGDRILQERQTYRQHIAAVIQGYRTRDAAFRLFRNEKLERYKTLFDLAARYSLLAANAYDYETGLLNTDAGRAFLSRIINARALGVVRNGEPQYAGSDTGDPGLSSALAEMKADWDVLRGRLGFNNPDAYGTTVSLRTECLRILPTSDGDGNWRDALQLARMDNLLDDQDVRRYCMQIDNGDGLPVPGLLLTFSTTIADSFNLFGRQLAAGDHAFSPSSFATKIFAVGVALEGYRGMDDPAANAGVGGTSPSDPAGWFLDPLALSATPYIYLIPVGVDSMRSPPLGDLNAIRTWTVNDVSIPLPFNIGASALSTLPIWQSGDSLSEALFAIRKHQAFRPVSTNSVFSRDLYGPTGTLQRSQYTNNRLVGRSVWNSQWKLVIPGRTLLYDPNEGLDRFLQTVRDMKLHFVTYSYSGN